MNENQAQQSNLVDTTDCLEAVGVFRGWKNFMFAVVVLCLLLLQASFWLVDTGAIEPGKLSITEVITEPVNTARQIAEISEVPLVEQIQPAQKQLQRPQEKSRAFFGITFVHLSWFIRLVNAVLILSATLYVLTMLFSLKISLLGRLGGMNHISRAFFLSLVMLIFLLPWQVILDSVVMGAMFTPRELEQWCTDKSQNLFGLILHYLRFTGYWALVMLFLILSQLRSARWAKAILRRLEVI